MLFNSGEFFVFFLAVCVAYYTVRSRISQNTLLLGASYIFYGWWDYRFLALIMLSTAVDYVAGLCIHAGREKGRTRRSKVFLLISIVVNLGILGTFKYYDFFAGSLVDLTAALGITLNPFTLDVILPVGISFYTFQTMSYSLDVYRGRIKPVRNLPDFALFVAFFPQLMAGPIERARYLMPQIQAPRKVTVKHLQTGSWLILWGLFKKVLIADSLAPYSHWAFSLEGAQTGLDLYVAGVAFCFRFYCDFSGYSDMAIGLASLLGIRLSTNFRLPYFSTNPSALWSRWHITLSAWFRDYVYGVLRGRGSLVMQKQFALIATMSLVGLWHGAAWTFVLWGSVWGVILAIHRILHTSIETMARRITTFSILVPVGGAILTFNIWLFVGYLFVANDLNHGLHMQLTVISDLFSYSDTTLADALTVAIFVTPLLLVQIGQLVSGDRFVVLRLPAYARVALYTVLIALMFAKGIQHPREFIYFQF